ncbi:MAG: hypothetical protein ACRDMU_08540, partial [Gaiellaceae bacterium]
VDDPAARHDLARETGATVVDTVSAALAATGRLAGVVRAVSDTPWQPVGRLAHGATPDGATDWRVVGRALVSEPAATIRTARAAGRALTSLRHAATVLAVESVREP